MSSKKSDNVEAIYPLSPLQEGMLYHSISDPSSAVYLEQYICHFRGPFRPECLKAAWENALQRHDVLRTLVMWKRKDKPLQVVRKTVSLPWTEIDLSDRPNADQQAEFNNLIEADRQKGFELTTAPLMRFSVVKFSDQHYGFLLSFHHLILDGWSSAMLYKEVYSDYEKILNGETVQIEKSQPYKRYISWLQAQDKEKAREFWTQQLSGLQAATQLDIYNPQPVTSSNENERFTKIEELLSPELSDNLYALSRKLNITVNSIIQAGWSILLARYTSSNDVVFGTVVSGRPVDLPGSQEMLGLFINTVPVRTQITESSPVASYIKDIHQQQLDIRDYEYSPLVDIHGWSEVPRTQNLFENLVVFEYASDEEEQGFADVAITDEDSFELTNFPLVLGVCPSKQLLFRLYYDLALYDHHAAKQLITHLQTILASFAENPDQILSDVTLLTETEMNTQIVGWNETRQSFDEQNTFVALFEAQAKRQPEKTAVIFNDEKISYQTLSAESDRFANYLSETGVEKGSLVGVCLARSSSMMVALLGILKAGCAYLPLDPDYPAERIHYILDDANVTTVVTDDESANLVQGKSFSLINLSENPAQNNEASYEPNDRAIGGDDIAYVIYTSGSTGKPKGVVVPHRSVANFIQAMAQTPGISESDTLLAVTTLSFDISVLELFLPLCFGATVDIASRETLTDGIKLSQRIEASNITIMQATPATWRLLLSSQWPGKRDLKVLCGGEALSKELADALLSNIGELWNMYGPTETTVWSLTEKISADKDILIGKPIANTSLYVLDPLHRPLPVGVPGELYIAGAGVTKGYLDRDTLTKERFIDNPFSDSHAIMYRTGDLVRYRTDGSIEYLNRLDNQVKIRGYRIELGEIESRLMEIDEIRLAVVSAFRISAEDVRLVGYYQLQDGTSLTVTVIRNHLKKVLPAYMIPQNFMEIKKIPLTPNGKVDRKKLPSPFSNVSLSNSEPPETAMEKKIAAIWQELIGIQNVGRHDNFFELGGHSLLSMQTIIRIRDETGYQLDLRTIAMEDLQTIAHLCEVHNENPDQAQDMEQKGLMNRLKQVFMKPGSRNL